MVTSISLFGFVVFHLTAKWITSADELLLGTFDDGISTYGKPYTGISDKNFEAAIRSRAIPPMLTPYRNVRKWYLDDGDDEQTRLKRYLASVAKTGNNAKIGKSPRKKSSSMEEFVDADDLLRTANDKYELPNLTLMKQEMIDSMKPILLQYLNEAEKKYDPLKVELFLQNLANAVFDRNEEFAISMDNIKALIRADYFHPEKISPPKRNLQSVVRDLNRSPSGNKNSQTRTNQFTSAPNEYRDDRKRNLQSLMKNKSKRYLGTIVKNNKGFKSNMGKREIYGNNLNENFVDPYLSGEFNNRDDYLNVIKRHTVYDINEPDMSMIMRMPSQNGQQIDTNDYDEQMGQDAAISIGKRYLGALARSGWLPRSFTLRSSENSPHEYDDKRYIGAIARLGSLRAARVQETPTYYYRGGRGFEFRPPLHSHSRAYLRSEPDYQNSRCSCKRDTSDSSWNRSYLDLYPEYAARQIANVSEK